MDGVHQGHEEQKAELESIRQKWRRKRQELAAKPLARTTRAYLRKLSWQYEREEIQAARSRQAGNWLDFLRDKAIREMKPPWYILRSRQEVVAPERGTDQQEVGNSPLVKETKNPGKRRPVTSKEALPDQCCSDGKKLSQACRPASPRMEISSTVFPKAVKSSTSAGRSASARKREKQRWRICL